MRRERVMPCPATPLRHALDFAAFAAFLFFLMLWIFGVQAQASETRCARAEGAIGMDKSLPTLWRKIFAGEPIRIVALGSSSTEGTPEMPKDQIFVAVLGRELARQVLTPIEIVNKGKGGETIAKMVDRLQRDVFNLKPDLLVWQLGVNDVLQMDGVDGAVDRMKAALDDLKAHDVPVVLVDLQSSPLVDRDKDTPAMQAAIEEAGQKLGVMHFHRRAFMRRMVEEQAVVSNDLVQPDGLHMTQLGHFCTGSLLATQIARASLKKPVSSVASINPER